MPSRPATISAEEVLGFLSARRESQGLDDERASLRRAYRHAAAVLAGITDLSSLRPFGQVATDIPAQELLAEDLVPVKAKRLGGQVMLSASVRQLALQELAGRGELIAALEANPKERTGPVQAQFESYLKGSSRPLDQQTLAELEDTLQVLLWLEEIPTGHALPALGDVRRRLDYLRLLAPFEALAGDEIFRGRRQELDQLRSYIGVLAPESLLRRLADGALSWIRPVQQPALSVFGPGGVGKSALMARFMLEHSRLDDKARLPFAYLDFDRPTIDIANPLTICAEMIRQLGLQFPHIDELPNFLKLVQRQATEISGADQIGAAANALADLLGIIEGELGPRPYVVTLDTFEEVQYRGEAIAFPFWDLLSKFQISRPFLRVVVSGRTPTETLQLADKAPAKLELGSLDDAAAIGYLQSQGVDDKDLAAKIVRQVGSLPLSLKLAASLIRRDGGRAKGLRNLSVRSSFWMSASDEVIQGHLFQRILGHIHNPQVERLAHPGLVMRRITPEVILNVLNEPCRLGIQTLAEAEALFNELGRETALVTVNQDEEEELVHRPDLRRIMLKMLVEKAPAQVQEIHQRAVEWYSSRHGLRAQAEALYHRLQLGQWIDKREIEDRSIRFSIQTSIVEFPVEVQVMLAGYGLDVSKEVLQSASRSEREAAIVAQIEDMLPYGSRSLVHAMEMTDGLLRDTVGASPVWRAAARVYFEAGRIEHANELVEQGLSLAIRSGNTRLALDLLREKAWAHQNDRDSDSDGVLEALREYAQRHGNQSALLQERAQWFAKHHASNFDAAEVDDGVTALHEIASILRGLTSLELWELVPALGLVLPHLPAVCPETPQLLRPLLIDGPFEIVSFPDKRADRALRNLLLVLKDGRARPLGSNDRIVPAFLELCHSWPYRVLQVQPPYGSRGSYALSEAAR